MPTVLPTTTPGLIVRRLGRHDLAGLEEHLPHALGGDVEPWFEGPCT